MNICFYSYLRGCKLFVFRRLYSLIFSKNQYGAHDFTDGNSCFDIGYSWGGLFKGSFSSVQFRVKI